MLRIPKPRPRGHAGLFFVLLLAAALPLWAAGYDDYHSVKEVEAQLGQWADQNANLTLIDIGKSAGGKVLWVARIAADGPLSADQRPAVFVGANAAGFHNAGTEAALALVEALLADENAELISHRTFYVAPILNPDAHDALFAGVRVKRQGNAESLDRDRDGFMAEDGFDDLDGDGRITQLRIPDPKGAWLPHPEEPRLMVRQDAKKGWVGSFRLTSEGQDDDDDGEVNEDPEGGIAVDHNFPHAFPYPDPEAGPWPGVTSEAKAVLDFLWSHRQIAVALVYGPANNLLELPKPTGPTGDLGTQTFKLPEEPARFLGLDPEAEYTIDEVWEAAKDLPFVRAQGITKDDLAQFLGAGPATKLEDADQKTLEGLAKDYKLALEDAGLDKERPVAQYAKGGITPFLYYQYGALALELDVWGIPKAKEEKKEGEDEKKLTVKGLADMSAEDFLAFSEEEIAAFLKEAGVPPQFSAAMVIERVKAGQITPARMAEMIKSGGGGGDGDEEGDDEETQRRREVLAWLDQNHPEAIAPWTAVTLPDGTAAEAGGLDPFAELAPPFAELGPAIALHTATALELAKKIARVEVVSLDAEALGGSVYRVKAVARNAGELATHTQMATRNKARLPVRLELLTGAGVRLVTGQGAALSERLEGRTGTLEGTWLVQADPGAVLKVRVTSEHAGRDEKTLTLAQGGAR